LKQKKREKRKEKRKKKRNTKYLIRHQRKYGLGAHGLVVFQSKSSVEQLMDPNKPVVATFTSKGTLLGLQKWTAEYHEKRPKKEELQAKVNQTIKQYDQQKALERKLLLEKSNQPDEEGFITVTRQTRKNRANDGSVHVTAIKAREGAELKPKSHELGDFYRYQMRQSKRDQIAELRKKFEEDKKKIERMKAARRFNPY